MKNYTLTQSGDNGFNIGTIQTDNFENLKKLIEKSCAAHFDLEISNVGIFEEDFKNERFLGGDKFFFYITVKDGDEKWREEIAISQTWIYSQEIENSFNLFQVVNKSGNPASNELGGECIFSDYEEAKNYIDYLVIECGNEKDDFKIINFIQKIKREEFLNFFRSDDYNEKMSSDDCMEVFTTSIKGSSDLSVELFNEILSDYGCDFQVKKV